MNFIASWVNRQTFNPEKVILVSKKSCQQCAYFLSVQEGEPLAVCGAFHQIDNYNRANECSQYKNKLAFRLTKNQTQPQKAKAKLRIISKHQWKDVVLSY